MKYLKKTNSEFEFNFVQNPANTEYVQTTVYTRTQEEYDELVEQYTSEYQDLAFVVVDEPSSSIPVYNPLESKNK